MISRKE